ncbi:thioredoxin [Streptomyces sp. NPDC127068]|uniref:thioredoxin n=1 Tax=Streptomyces sp. NPDC127068 TaxID=3347127 RepID=UPI00366596A7
MGTRRVAGRVPRRWMAPGDGATPVGGAARNIPVPVAVVPSGADGTPGRTSPETRKQAADMSRTVELTKENFDQTVTDNEFVLIDFWAAWCGPCRQFAPVYEQAAEANPDLVFAKVDTEAQPELAQAFGIQSIPTLMIVRDQVAVFSQPGALPQAVLDDVIGQARGLDMDEVRKSIAAEEKQTEASGPNV